MNPVTGEKFKKLLLEEVCLEALLQQAKKDRDDGKTLCPKMDNVVNIYSKILTDHPAPVTPGATQ